MEFGKKNLAILFGVKNNPYAPIFSLVGVGEISEWNFWKLFSMYSRVGQFFEFLAKFVFHCHPNMVRNNHHESHVLWTRLFTKPLQTIIHEIDRLILDVRPLFWKIQIQPNQWFNSNTAHAFFCPLIIFPAWESQTRDLEFFTIENERDYFARYFKNCDVVWRKLSRRPLVWYSREFCSTENKEWTTRV